MDKNDEMKQLVREFIAILEVQEQTEDGAIFNPTVIRSCRCLHTIRLEEIMSRLKDLSEE